VKINRLSHFACGVFNLQTLPSDGKNPEEGIVTHSLMVQFFITNPLIQEKMI